MYETSLPDDSHRLRLEEELERHRTDLEFEKRNAATEVLNQQQEVEILKVSSGRYFSLNISMYRRSFF